MPGKTVTNAAARRFVAATIAAAVLGVVLSAQFDPWFQVQAPSTVAIVSFVVVALLLELAEHQLAVSATGSIAFIIFIASALVFGPTWGCVVTSVSFAGAHLLNRRPPLKVGFNVSQYVLSILLSSGTYIAAGGMIPPESLDHSLGPFAAMVVVFFAVNSLAVSKVVALSQERGLWEVWRRNTWTLAAYDLVASTIALAIAFLYGRYGVFAVAGVVAPILFLRHIYMVNLQLQVANREMLDVMVKSIEARDPYTSGHSQRVAEFARLIARELGLGLGEIDRIATAALLHDVGKIYEEFAPLLRKTSRLTADEYRTMRSHPIKSAELVATVSGLRGYVEKAVRHHHENIDGSGYPDGLKEEDIPIGARVIMVADTVDAMTSHRPYRDALSYEEVLIETERFSGTQFDPDVVAAFRSSSALRNLLDSNREPEGSVQPRAEGRAVRLA